MIYQYQCDACQSSFEIKHVISECDQRRTCEICGAQLRRVMQTPTVIWAGRALMRENGVDDHYVFPKMESVRREDRTYRGIDFNEQARATKTV